MIEPITSLIDALAEVAVEDYLREQADSHDGSGADGENPVLPHDREAA